MKYDTHIDDRHILVISYFFAASFTLVLCVILLGASLRYLLLTSLFLIFVILYCYFFTQRSYYFNKKGFIVKIGFVKKKYYYSDINKCFITYNNKISYATSTKRICIKCKKNNKNIYISPEDMDEVLMLLINRRA